MYFLYTVVRVLSTVQKDYLWNDLMVSPGTLKSAQPLTDSTKYNKQHNIIDKWQLSQHKQYVFQSTNK